MRTIRTVLPVVAVLALSFPSSAGIRPFFYLLYSAWHATDIVVVTEGEAVDGDVTVLDVWHGSLTVGESITIPELRAFASDASRTVERLWRRKGDDTPPVIVSAKRMVLFLRRAPATRASDKGTRGSDWRPASNFGGMKTNIAWITDGRVYAFAQPVNPGPSILWPQRHSEAEMRIEVDRVLTEQRLLRRIAALKDPRARARQAANHLTTGSPYALDEALAILDGCGEAALPMLRAILRTKSMANGHKYAMKALARVDGKDALPVLRGILRDESKASLHGCAVRALGTAGGEAVVPELTAIVEKELQFWKKTAPGLKPGWRKGTGLERERVGFLMYRYNLVVEVFHALQRIRSPACRDAVARFGDYWRSLPQLYDRSGFDYMSIACDGVLHALPEE